MAEVVRTETATVYVRNLKERGSLQKLKNRLEEQFSKYGEILSITAHRNLRMRGQAFIAYKSPESAKKAVTAMDGQLFDDRPVSVQFAKTNSDAVLKATEPEKVYLETVARRQAAKERKEAQKLKQSGLPLQDTNKRPAAAPLTGKPPAKKAKEAGKNEYNPPYRIILVQNIAKDVPKEQLDDVFAKFQGFIEVRYVPVRNLAFVEFETDEDAITAKEQTVGLELGGQGVSVTYAKR